MMSYMVVESMAAFCLGGDTIESLKLRYNQ